MATLKQIEANRKNALKSTGPRTREGKAVASLNLLRHGIFATHPVPNHENPEAFEIIRKAHLDTFQPESADEETLVMSLARNAWLLDRFFAAENELWNKNASDLSERNSVFPLATALQHSSKELQALQRRIDSAQRNYRRDLEILAVLQGARAKANPEPNSQTEPPQADTAEIGSPNPNFAIFGKV